MGKYNKWNQKQLLTYYNELIQRFIDSKNTDQVVLRDIASLDTLIKGPTPAFISPECIQGKIYEDQMFLLKDQKFIKDIEKFKDLSHSLKNKKNLVVDERDISNSILLSVTHDFYNSLDSSLAKHFNKVFKDRKDNLKFTDEHSIAVYLPSLETGYINLEKTDTLYDFINLIHEYAHLIQDRVKYRDSRLNYPLNEMLPILMEMLALDYLEESFEDFEEDARTIKISTMKTNLKYASDLLKEYKYISNVDITKRSRDMIADIAMVTNTSKRDSLDLLNISAEEKLSYIIPTILDIELYYLFYFDREKCIDLIYRLIETETNDYRKYIKDSGIVLNQHSKQYIKEIKRDSY
jgi:hypothetical protein